MPGLSENFFATKSFTLVAAALAFLGAAILLSVIFRFAFGRGLRLPRNGRGARLPRLGTVDAFDLDRQRQLVIIRRDNVEHLLMIGGPNDLVIESQIIRAESRDPRDFRDARLREKELREKEAMPAGAAWPSPDDSPSPLPPQRKMPFPAAAALESETTGAGARLEEPAGFAPSTVFPPQRPPVFPAPPRRVSSPSAPASQRTPNHRESGGRLESLQRSEPMANPAKEFRRASVATPFLRPSPHRQPDSPAVRLAPSGGPDAPADIDSPALSSRGIEENPAPPEIDAAAETGAAPAPPSAADEAPAFAANGLFQDAPPAEPVHPGVDTLETEMAKLLGRGPG